MRAGVSKKEAWRCTATRHFQLTLDILAFFNAKFKYKLPSSIVMVDTGIFCTTAEVNYKTGAGASATSKAEAYVNSYVTQAESTINTLCRYNFSDNYSSLNADVKGILKQVASDLAAIYVVAYDMSGYNSRADAEDLINVLRDSALRGMSLLRDKKQQDFINGA